MSRTRKTIDSDLSGALEALPRAVGVTIPENTTIEKLEVSGRL